MDRRPDETARALLATLAHPRRTWEAARSFRRAGSVVGWSPFTGGLLALAMAGLAVLALGPALGDRAELAGLGWLASLVSVLTVLGGLAFLHFFTMLIVALAVDVLRDLLRP